MRVIYISGSGRSGSTLLERILHSAAPAAAVGEFHCLWRMDRQALNCACGHSAQDDAFWPRTLAAAGIGAAELAELRRLEAIVARSGYVARHGHRIAALAAAPETQAFLGLQLRIFEAIAAQTGQNLIIDSSKAGPRAWIMACDPRVSLVHLYRAPGDVIASWRSRKFDKGLGGEMQRLSLGRAALDWWKVEHLARRLARERPVHMIDYHQLCAQPRPVVDGALAALGLAPTRDEAWLAADRVAPTQDYHSLNGNPDRFERSPIAIALRQTDWGRYPPAERQAIKCLGQALSLAYPRP